MGVSKTASTPTRIRRMQHCGVQIPAEESGHIPDTTPSSKKIQQRRLDLFKSKRIASR